MSALPPFAVSMMTGRLPWECVARILSRTSPVHFRHDDVEQDKVKRPLADQVESDGAAFGLDDVETRLLEAARHEVAIGGQIIDHQDATFAAVGRGHVSHSLRF